MVVGSQDKVNGRSRQVLTSSGEVLYCFFEGLISSDTCRIAFPRELTMGHGQTGLDPGADLESTFLRLDPHWM